MKRTSTSQDRESRERSRWRDAAAEAAQLRRAIYFHKRRRLTWMKAQARAGLGMPHSTFHRRLAILRKSGVAGLVDHRHPPASRLTSVIRGFIQGLGQGNPLLPTAEILDRTRKHFRLAKKRLSLRSVQDVLKDAGLARPMRRFQRKSAPLPETAQSKDPPPVPEEQREELGGAGLAWLRVASDLTGYGREMAAVVSEVALSLPPPAEPIPVDRDHRDEKGRFLADYNAPRERRDPQVGAAFESVEVKREDKDLTRLSIRTTKLETIENKLLALIALPVVSEKGRFDGVTDPRGEWLRSLWILDYKPETLAKTAREMKYAGVGGPLMDRHASLWHGQLEGMLGEDASAVVAYVDTTAKPYWTEILHKSGRVATVGRIMPCLETALIHTGSGVPLYLKTYAGHASLAKNVLPLVHQMEDAIGQGMLARLTVIDGEANAVALFRQFDDDIDPKTGEIGRYFITPLSHAQVKTLDVVQDLTDLIPYRDGDRIGGGWLDLQDSTDLKSAPYRVRVVVLERRTKKTFSAYATNAPKEEFTDELLMDDYFRRWPAQELVIRALNGALAFKAVHGYGKRKVVNITVVDQLTKLDAQIERLTHRVDKAQTEERAAGQCELEADEDNQARQDWKEGARHWEEHVIEKRRDAVARMCAAHDTQQASLSAEVSELKLKEARTCHREAIAKVKKLQAVLDEKQAEANVLASRREIYQCDVELDQILSSLKLGCALLVQVVLLRFFGGLAIDFNKFIREIIALSGTRIITPTVETIQFRANLRNPELMDELEKACERFNAVGYRRGDRFVRFEVMRPPGSRHAA